MNEVPRRLDETKLTMRLIIIVMSLVVVAITCLIATGMIR
jgi:hypothetical protein